MLERLTEGFQSALRNLSGQGSISEKNVRDAMAQVRESLLVADVALEVVEKFCDQVVQEAIGKKVTEAVKPGEEMIKIVHDRLVVLLGGEPGKASDPGVHMFSPGPTVIMMCGLQGSGKTTTCGKIAAWLRKKDLSSTLVAADLQRPAAVEQLETVAQQAGALPGSAPVRFHGELDQIGAYGERVGVAVDVCKRGIRAAKQNGSDVAVLDTAGRLHVNDDLMGELKKVKAACNPHYIFLVVDSMTGQDAVRSAKAFHEQLGIDGVILTKFDSDTRGGAALSVREVTGAPVRFVGTGEGLNALEPFHPERFAGRILGMGDVVSLVEKAQQEVTEEEAEKLQNKMMRGELGMDDFLKQLKTIRKLGPMKQVLGMLPGVGSALKDVNIDDKELDRVEAQIQSMTAAERTKPKLIDNSRKRRIAKGAGVDQQTVGRLVKQFNTINQLTRGMGDMSARSKMSTMTHMAQGAGGSSDAAAAAAMMPSISRKRGTKGGKPKGFKQRKKRK
ncbi:MAG: signal recognition particle protein [Phycisphaerales bacterium JB060]